MFIFNVVKLRSRKKKSRSGWNERLQSCGSDKLLYCCFSALCMKQSSRRPPPSPHSICLARDPESRYFRSETTNINVFTRGGWPSHYADGAAGIRDPTNVHQPHWPLRCRNRQQLLVTSVTKAVGYVSVSDPHVLGVENIHESIYGLISRIRAWLSFDPTSKQVVGAFAHLLCAKVYFVLYFTIDYTTLC